MQRIKAKVPKNSVNIYALGDLHGGGMTFKENQCRKHIAKIAREPNARVILMGDLIEAITPTDPRFMIGTTNSMHADPIAQANFIVDLLYPIRHKILGVLEGNHERKIRGFGNITKDIICKNLKVPYGTYTAIFNINDSFEIFAWHGAGISRFKAGERRQRKTNSLIALKRKLVDLYGSALVMLMRHIHRLQVLEPDQELYLEMAGDELKEGYTNTPIQSKGLGYIHPDARWYASTGCFRGLYQMGESGYEETFGLDPTELGYIKIVIRDNALVRVEKVVI